MRKTLLATAAAAALVGFTSMAAAQSMEGQSKGTANPTGAAQEQKGGGAGNAMTPQPSAVQSQKTPGASSGQSAQGQGLKTDQRLGQGQKNDVTPQRGAQDERGLPEKGGPQKGAQQEPDSKQGVNATAQHTNQSGSRGASVQLSQVQRTKIQGIVGRSSGARVSSNVNFNMRVGARVPRDVHVEVLPQDVVEIVPQYEGFDYVLVGDNILIIDPESLEIVAIIPA